jgi:hypothetical protein
MVGMTAAPSATADASAPEATWALVSAPVLGVLVGTLTLLAHEHLPHGIDLLGNSAALWAAVAFLAGRRARTPGAGALAGGLALIATAVAYYAALWLFAGRGDDPHVERIWLTAAVVAGPVYGLLGAWSAQSRAPWHAVAAAVLGATFAGEAIALSRIDGVRPVLVVELWFGLMLPFAFARTRAEAEAILGWLVGALLAGSALAVAGYDLLARRL